MHIGVPLETHTGETRVAATPETIKKLIAQGHQVTVQTGAGVTASLPDHVYEIVGADIGDAATTLGADLVLKVLAPNDAELAQMFEVRMLLEDKLLRLAIPNMTADTFARAERICQEFVGEDDVGRWAELNWELHACLYEPAQRPFMISLIRSVNDKLERYLRMQMSLSAGKHRADHEHREILDACRAGDVELAVKLLDEHIAGVCKTLFEHLPQSH